MSQGAKTSSRWDIVWYIAVCTPMVLLPINTVRDAYCDVQTIHRTALKTEISRLRSQAMRRAGQLEFALDLQDVDVQERDVDWESLRRNEWLKEEWKTIGSPAGHDLYAAIVDLEGIVVLHNDPSLIGRRIGLSWYQSTVPEAGNDVVRLENRVLAASKAAFDVRIPLRVHGREIGAYHEGLDAGWFDREVASMQRDALRPWLWILALMIVADVIAGAALYRIASRQAQLQAQVDRSQRDRTTQLAQIASGLAHEIRNPLHALRLNLHALGKALSGKVNLSQEELLDTVRESDMEINQLDALLRDLVRFATPDAGKLAEVNVVSEVQATLSLLEEDMRQKGIEVRSRYSDQSVYARFDAARLRQMLVNLLTFAQNNVGPQGQIDVEVTRRGAQAEVVIADSGPSLSDTQIRRVFEPFQAPRETGSGLGLALVQLFATEAGGSVVCETGRRGGNRFRLLLPHIVRRRI